MKNKIWRKLICWALTFCVVVSVAVVPATTVFGQYDEISPHEIITSPQDDD